LRPPLIDGGDHFCPEKWLIPDDRDDAVDGERGRNARGDGRCLCSKNGRYERGSGQKLSDHPRSYTRK
jgi:hypothetical protein